MSSSNPLNKPPYVSIVIAIVACPIRACSTFGCAPSAKLSAARVCLKFFGVHGVPTDSITPRFHALRRNPVQLIGFPVALLNTNGVSDG